MARRWVPVIVTTGVAALLAVAAIITADRAACPSPGRYVPGPSGMVLVGGCLNSNDLPVATPPVSKSPSPPAKPPLGD
jgi:hypothetical protein